MEDMTLEDALDYIKMRFDNYNNEPPESQEQLKMVGVVIVEAYERVQLQDRRLKEAAAARNRQSAKERRETRKKLIGPWCEENLTPGMIVKVKAKNSSLRQVTAISPSSTLPSGYRIEGTVRGQHVQFKKFRDETGKIKWELQPGDYITNHVFYNVEGVVTGYSPTGQPIVTPIMELIESKT